MNSKVSPRTERAQFTRDWFMYGMGTALLRRHLRIYEFQKILDQAFLHGETSWL